MSWVRLDEDFTDHPKVVEAGPLAGWLHVKALSYCNRYLTDGRVPGPVARTLVSWEDVAPIRDVSRGDKLSSESINVQLVARLVGAGMWIEVDGGYQIHDYLKFQPSRAKVQAERETERVRKEAWRTAKEAKKSTHLVPPVVPLGQTAVSQLGPALSDSVSDTDTKDQKKPSPASPWEFEEACERVYREVYPRHEGKSRGMRTCRRQITTQAKFDRWCSAVSNYAAHVAGRASEHIKQFDSFMSVWQEYEAFQPSLKGVAQSSKGPLPPREAVTEDSTSTL